MEKQLSPLSHKSYCLASFYGYALTVIILISSHLAFAEDAPYFTNDSLKKYRSGPMAMKEQPEVNAITPNLESDINKKTNNESERDYYCRRATELKKQIESAKDKVEKQKSTPAKDYIRGMNYDGNVIFLERYPGIEMAEAQVKAAERELADFEDKAHRKDIPPGWLRCQ